MEGITAEKILSLLAELYADQNNVKIKYHIATRIEGGKENERKDTD